MIDTKDKRNDTRHTRPRLDDVGMPEEDAPLEEETSSEAMTLGGTMMTMRSTMMKIMAIKE